jgi:hypothetical protein
VKQILSHLAFACGALLLIGCAAPTPFTSASQLVNFAIQIAPLDPRAPTGFAATGTPQAVPEQKTILQRGAGPAGAATVLRHRREPSRSA